MSRFQVTFQLMFAMGSRGKQPIHCYLLYLYLYLMPWKTLIIIFLPTESHYFLHYLLLISTTTRIYFSLQSTESLLTLFQFNTYNYYFHRSIIIFSSGTSPRARQLRITSRLVVFVWTKILFALLWNKASE